MRKAIVGKALLWGALGLSIGVFVSIPFALFLGESSGAIAAEIGICGLVGLAVGASALLDKTVLLPLWARAAMGFIDCLVIYGGLFACGWIGRLQFSGALFGLCFLAIIGAVALSQRIYFKSIEEGEAGSQSDIAP